MFQSAPLTKARGDCDRLAVILLTKRFNPLPSQKQGETQKDIAIEVERLLFQSAPLTKARGDLDKRKIKSNTKKFQSAPLTKARGDSHIKTIHSQIH